MSKILDEFNNKQIAELSKGKEIPKFKVGDTISAVVNIADDGSVRLQTFTGLCIKKRNRGLHSSFTLRKIGANSVGVERYFPVYSPIIKEVIVVKRGVVRRAKLYYIRNLSGKAARIREEKKDYGNANK